jgi:hypothetical protein
MNKKELNSLVREGLSFCLEPDGYKHIKSQNEFSLKKGGFTYTISHNCVDRRPEFTIEFFLKIRHEDVENIANMFSSSDPAFFKYSTTILVRLSYFTGKLMKFEIRTEDDIKNIFNNFLNFFYKTNIKPFFETYSTIENLSKIVNDSVTNEISGIPVNVRTYQKNIILLKLTNNSDFENRVKMLWERIKEYPDMDKDMFENTYNYLKSL